MYSKRIMDLFSFAKFFLKIKSLFIQNTSHDFHTEKPVEIAEYIGEFLME